MYSHIWRHPLAPRCVDRDGSLHTLWLDGVYDANVEPPQRKPRLRRTRAPSSAQLTQLANTFAHRVCRHLARKGWLEGEDESVFLSVSAGSEDGLDALRMSSITYRIATGRGAREPHAGELCRYITRPAISEKRLSI